MTIEHKLLHGSAIVTIKIPKNLSEVRTLTDTDENIIAVYQQYPINLPGGVVNVFLQSEDTSLAGTTIRARLEVMMKTTESDREFIFVNLHPVDKSEQPTHRLVVLDHSFAQSESWEIFPAPNMRGYVALMGPDEKVPERNTAKGPVASKQRRVPQRKAA